MPDDHPLRGAPAVDDELEVGFSANFERRWRIAELVARGAMILFVLAAIVGVFGHGPFSHRTHRSADGHLAVDFEPIARFGTTTQVTLHLSGLRNDPEQRARVFLSSALVEPMGLQDELPRAVDTEAVGGGIIFTFNIPPGEDSALIRLVLKPAVIGPVTIDVRQAGEPLSFTQWVLP